MNKKKILIITAKYYSSISEEMESKTVEYLQDHFSDFSSHKSSTIIKTVPGVFEIPVVIAQNIKRYDGFVALGCVIKGETPHFEFISSATTNAIMKLSIDYKKPIGNGIITCLNMKQAIVRSETKGQEAAKAVLSVLGY